MHIRQLLKFRYVSWIAVISSLAGALLMFIIGAKDTEEAFWWYFKQKMAIAESVQSAHTSSLAMANLISAVDEFLFALVLIIFGFGIYHLFLSSGYSEEETSLPGWAKITSITEMKTTLAQVVIVILFVEFLESVIRADLDWLPWQGLALPAAILLLAGALRLMHGRD